MYIKLKEKNRPPAPLGMALGIVPMYGWNEGISPMYGNRG
jgi:hypothetical protein